MRLVGSHCLVQLYPYLSPMTLFVTDVFCFDSFSSSSPSPSPSLSLAFCVLIGEVKRIKIK